MEVIGKKIKMLRTLNNLTQEELASRCDLTKGYISQLENDLTSPSIATLVDILDVLGSNLNEFFSSDTISEKIVFTKENYFSKNNEYGSITWLITNAQKNEMEPILLNLYPNQSTPIDYPHEGEEFGYVIEGNILVCLDNQKFKCKKGESFYYESSKTHYLKNTSNSNAKIIWISSPPNF
ncbi:transcriptional regulator XRE family [Firmicutes bacterium CAG:449]|nr:transcriptional regulator XRE family [Firmicutes bacterium CAG:449]